MTAFNPFRTMDDLLHLGGGPYRWGRDSNDPVLSGLPMAKHSLGSMDPMCLGAQGWSWSRGHGELASVFEPASETFKGRYRCEVVGRSHGTTGHQDPAYLCGADGADFGGIGGGPSQGVSGCQGTNTCYLHAFVASNFVSGTRAYNYGGEGICKCFKHAGLHH